MTKFFRAAPLATAALITTLAFVGVWGYFLVRIILSLVKGGSLDSFDLLAGFALALTIGYGWLRSVKGYSLGEREVIVNRVGPGKVHISMDDIRSAEAQPNLGAFIRVSLLSIQGLFGWSGNANVRKPTDIQSLHARVYGTNPANTVVLQLANGQTVILTPLDAVGFADALREAGVGGPAPVASGRYKSTFKGKKKRS